MTFDDIIIGSGLTALGVAMGLPAGRRVLVIGGPEVGELSYYDGNRGVPSSYVGHGGLGRYWHGVIPASLDCCPPGLDVADFIELFHLFYPRTEISTRVGQPYLFVPREPIRTPRAWAALQRSRPCLKLDHSVAQSFTASGGSVTVAARSGRFAAARLWIAAGVLHTPQMLTASLADFEGLRTSVDDHVIVYMGAINRVAHPEVPAPKVERSADGYWTAAAFNPSRRALFTLKPARFDYRKLDYGIEQRAAFGLPAGGVIAKLLRTSSPGLLSEALFNKFGLFPDSTDLSVYAQVLVPDAYRLGADRPSLRPNPQSIQRAVSAARQDPAWAAALQPSQKPQLFINGIHLHHSVELRLLEKRGVNLPGGPVQVVDASVAHEIGPEHHSFKLMAAAFAKAKRS